MELNLNQPRRIEKIAGRPNKASASTKGLPARDGALQNSHQHVAVKAQFQFSSGNLAAGRDGGVRNIRVINPVSPLALWPLLQRTNFPLPFCSSGDQPRKTHEE
jgi:hypothetical protein